MTSPAPLDLQWPLLPPLSSSPAPTLVGEVPIEKKTVEPQPLASVAPLRKYLLLAFFCLG
ncbi:hypothetical protein FS749_012333 [Ceratobasidium sp. UAMH 11750]|nr:hypothetical protein FS749_012333 [Ceratobasidium sp. UAMH 11750]